MHMRVPTLCTWPPYQVQVDSQGILLLFANHCGYVCKHLVYVGGVLPTLVCFITTPLQIVYLFFQIAFLDGTKKKTTKKKKAKKPVDTKDFVIDENVNIFNWLMFGIINSVHISLSVCLHLVCGVCFLSCFIFPDAKSFSWQPSQV